jgi:uncharacterized small protein (DUF1192 family)
MADTDDLEPKPKPQGEPDFETLGIEELEDYIAGLEATIVKIRGFIAAKQAHRGSADSVFK